MEIVCIWLLHYPTVNSSMPSKDGDPRTPRSKQVGKGGAGGGGETGEWGLSKERERAKPSGGDVLTYV